MHENKREHVHPLTYVSNRIVSILSELGFGVALGPERETEYYNFDAVNIPFDHPSRDMQDTFWFENKTVLRTQTSAMQVRYMEKNAPPLAVVIPGRVFRNEATDMTHEVQFHQIEALYINKQVTLTQLKGVLEKLFKTLFSEEVKLRFRPSYFPFTEPSIEVDMSSPNIKNGAWVEVMGAGLVHPAVLKNGGIDPEEWSGFAFGIGVERIAMLLFGIPDIRMFFDGDIRFLKQF
ncbi:MAG: phenylalanine--tRNA ligase subunit alpha [Candidatus Paceibacterota bacterium]